MNYEYSLTLLMRCPSLCCHSSQVVKVCGHFDWKRIYAVLLLLFYICIVVGDSVIKTVVEIQLTGLTLPHFCVCSKPGTRFLTPYIVVFYMFKCVSREIVAVFVYGGGIYYHCCFCLLFILA